MENNQPTTVEKSRALAFLPIILLVVFVGYFVIQHNAANTEDGEQSQNAGPQSIIERDDRGIAIYESACESRSFTCADFEIKKDAQDVYNTCYTVEIPDRHGLDENKNGIACDE